MPLCKSAILAACHEELEPNARGKNQFLGESCSVQIMHFCFILAKLKSHIRTPMQRLTMPWLNGQSRRTHGMTIVKYQFWYMY